MLDVHIGFMDEETKPVLEQLMRLNTGSSSYDVVKSKYPQHDKIGKDEPSTIFTSVIDRLFLVNHDRPVYVIERDDIRNDTSLFQMVDNKYSLPWDCKVCVKLPRTSEEKAELGVVGAKDGGDKGKGQVVAEELAQSLGEAARRMELARQVALLWNSSAKTKLAANSRMAYTVCAYNTTSGNVDHRNPVIIVRAPEMGFQPELIRLHLQTIMLALNVFKREDAPQGAANVYMYGAGGALGSGTRPGQLQNIMASLYIGAEVYAPSIAGKAPDTVSGSREEATKNLGQKWVGVIAFACPDAHIVLYSSEPVDTAKAAIGLANAEFSKKGSGVATSIANCRQLAAKLYPSYSISLTSSSFIGGDIKAAARAHGLAGDCNMEDYHILRVIHEMKYNTSMPRLFNHGLARIDCDPPHIPSAMFDDFKEWAKTTRWTREHYIQGVLWGLVGVTYDAVDWNYAHWGFADKVEARYKTKMSDYVYVLKEGGKNRVLCPFYTELACDLLETAATNPKGAAAVFGDNHKNVAGFDQMRTLALEIKRTATESLRSSESMPELMKRIGEFVDELGKAFESAGLKKKDDDEWPIWARPGWTGAGWTEASAWAVVSVSATNPPSAINKVWSEKFPDGSPNGNLDRALYKSTNMMALQLLAPEGGSQIVHAHKWKNVMDELKSKHKTEWGPRLAKKDWKAEAERLEGPRLKRTRQQVVQERVDTIVQLINSAWQQHMLRKILATRQGHCRPIQSFNEGPPPPPAVF